MKYIRILFVSLFLGPVAAFAASNDFMVAAQLLSAAKNADIQQVQALINNGANVNYTDSTGLSIVCTALMNNDVRAAQILQMYGADASQCDRQIKQYKSRNTKTKGAGGLFGGLSSAHSIALTAAGAAVVVGGLLLLTDVFDPDNGNGSGGASGGVRPGGDGGGGSVAPDAAFTVPYGPAYLTADGKIAYSTAAYQDNLKAWDPSAGGIRERDFNFLRPTQQPGNNYITAGITVPLQNYLLIMHGYSSFANGYMGQGIFRDSATKLPVPVSNNAGGAAPVGVALITEHGINPVGSAGRGDGINYALGTAAGDEVKTVDKYFNYNAACANGTCGAESAIYDLSGSGTAMNPFVSANDNALAKIVGGWENAGRADGDLYGFVPNGRLAIYRTGGGKEWVAVPDPTSGAVQGTLTDGAGGVAGVIDAGDTITMGGVTYDISKVITGDADASIEISGKTYLVDKNSTLLKGVCANTENADPNPCAGVSDIAIYRGTDNSWYFKKTSTDSGVDAVYVIQNNNLYTQKTLAPADIKTFEAMYNARVGGVSVLANTSINPASRADDYLTTAGLDVLFSLGGTIDRKTIYAGQIDNYYDKVSSGSTSQGGYANSMFNNYNSSLPMIIMPAGEFEFGQNAGQSLTVLDPTFENYAPALYDSNLAYQFMTIVAVQHTTGTTEAGSISGYGNGTGSQYGPIFLSAWEDTNNTPTTADDHKYFSRKCGLTGLGLNGMDPWCFAAAGPTAEMAAASAAGAVAAVKGAFGYMSSQMIFALLALTADGPQLATNADGLSFSQDGLVAYLRSMYSLPPEYHDQNNALGNEEYLKSFAEVYGYGLINLERAMTPKKSVYFFDGTKIVSAGGNAYWRAAANTAFRSSAVLNPRAASISASFFDVLESADGTRSLPRVWKNEFALGVRDARGLYMGDTLGELQTRDPDVRRVQIGGIGFSMAMSQRPYNDNLGGLDAMTLDFEAGNWKLRGGYQRYFTDGASRFSGMSNPILGLASNAVVSDAMYNRGHWSVGARAFSGAITDEGLLENDPTISAQYMPARLGRLAGVQSSVAWHGDKVALSASFGGARESDTVLGAQTSGLLSMGQGNTMYIDTELRYAPIDDVALTARATFARTRSDATGDFILGVSDVDSDAFALGLDAGGFSFAVAQPLAVRRGGMKYAYADYDVVDGGDGRFDLNIVNPHVAVLDLSAQHRELRFTGSYRHNIGEFTDGAVGFIYRVNPNHTDKFGNESIFMLKLTHRVGI